MDGGLYKSLEREHQSGCIFFGVSSRNWCRGIWTKGVMPSMHANYTRCCWKMKDKFLRILMSMVNLPMYHLWSLFTFRGYWSCRVHCQGQVESWAFATDAVALQLIVEAGKNIASSRELLSQLSERKQNNLHLRSHVTKLCLQFPRSFQCAHMQAVSWWCGGHGRIWYLQNAAQCRLQHCHPHVHVSGAGATLSTEMYSDVYVSLITWDTIIHRASRVLKP